MSEIFEKLRIIAVQQNQLGEFPFWLMDEVINIADNQQQYQDKKQLIETLLYQINNFDLYAGTGCFDNSFGVEAIQSTLRKLNMKSSDSK